MTRALLFIEAAHVTEARAMAQQPPFLLSADSLGLLFVPAGSPTGQVPATHYWASGLFTDEQYTTLVSLAAALPWAECLAYDADNDATRPWIKLQELGLVPILEEPQN